MDSLTRIISLVLLLSISQFNDGPFGAADGCKIGRSSILLNFQKGDNIISKLMNKFFAKRTDEKQIDEITYPEAPPVPSTYVYSLPAQEEVQTSYQYYLPYQPAPESHEEIFIAPPQPTFYTNSQSSVNIEKDVNIEKNVNINKEVSSHPDVIQLPTSTQSKDHGSPIYSTSILINNEPKQIIPPQPLPNDSPRKECHGDCHLHIPHDHHDILPYSNGNSQSIPLNPSRVFPTPPSPVYPHPPSLAYPAPAPPVIPPTVSHDSHLDVSINRVHENKQTDHPVYASIQPSVYPVPESQVFPPIYRQESHSNVDIPVVPENRETNQTPILPNHQPFRTLKDYEHYLLSLLQRSYSSHPLLHYQPSFPASHPTNKLQTRYENYEPTPPEQGLPNEQSQPTIIEREKTSTVIVDTQPRADIPDTYLDYQSAELPPRIEEEYRLEPRRLQIVTHPPLHHTGAELRKNDRFSHSGTYVTHQERKVVPQVSYVDSSQVDSTNYFEKSKA